MKLPASAKNQTVNANHAQEKLREAEFLLENDGSAMGMGSSGMMRQMMSSMGAMKGGGMMGGAMGAGMMGGTMGRGGTRKRHDRSRAFDQG